MSGLEPGTSWFRVEHSAATTHDLVDIVLVSPTATAMDNLLLVDHGHKIVGMAGFELGTCWYGLERGKVVVNQNVRQEKSGPYSPKTAVRTVDFGVYEGEADLLKHGLSSIDFQLEIFDNPEFYKENSNRIFVPLGAPLYLQASFAPDFSDPDLMVFTESCWATPMGLGEGNVGRYTILEDGYVWCKLTVHMCSSFTVRKVFSTKDSTHRCPIFAIWKVFSAKDSTHRYQIFTVWKVFSTEDNTLRYPIFTVWKVFSIKDSTHRYLIFTKVFSTKDSLHEYPIFAVWKVFSTKDSTHRYPIFAVRKVFSIKHSTHDTVTFLPSSPDRYRFSLESFKFVPNVKEVKIHCSIMACDALDTSSRCHRGCHGDATEDTPIGKGDTPTEESYIDAADDEDESDYTGGNFMHRRLMSVDTSVVFVEEVEDTDAEDDSENLQLYEAKMRAAIEVSMPPLEDSVPKPQSQDVPSQSSESTPAATPQDSGVSLLTTLLAVVLAGNQTHRESQGQQEADLP
ncbi:hypothetical protein Bbelb_308610 [Branchiostoma belcheri]|nr:hypothetical protein Bbelb_308610 [Branchiostoma belcheri]